MDIDYSEVGTLFLNGNTGERIPSPQIFFSPWDDVCTYNGSQCHCSYFHIWDNEYYCIAGSNTTFSFNLGFCDEHKKWLVSYDLGWHKVSLKIPRMYTFKERHYSVGDTLNDILSKRTSDFSYYETALIPFLQLNYHTSSVEFCFNPINIITAKLNYFFSFIDVDFAVHPMEHNNPNYSDQRTYKFKLLSEYNLEPNYKRVSNEPLWTIKENDDYVFLDTYYRFRKDNRYIDDNNYKYTFMWVPSKSCTSSRISNVVIGFDVVKIKDALEAMTYNDAQYIMDHLRALRLIHNELVAGAEGIKCWVNDVALAVKDTWELATGKALYFKDIYNNKYLYFDAYSIIDDALNKAYAEGAISDSDISKDEYGYDIWKYYLDQQAEINAQCQENPDLGKPNEDIFKKYSNPIKSKGEENAAEYQKYLTKFEELQKIAWAMAAAGKINLEQLSYSPVDWMLHQEK